MAESLWKQLSVSAYCKAFAVASKQTWPGLTPHSCITALKKKAIIHTLDIKDSFLFSSLASFSPPRDAIDIALLQLIEDVFNNQRPPHLLPGPWHPYRGIFSQMERLGTST